MRPLDRVTKNKYPNFELVFVCTNSLTYMYVITIFMKSHFYRKKDQILDLLLNVRYTVYFHFSPTHLYKAFKIYERKGAII